MIDSEERVNSEITGGVRARPETVECSHAHSHTLCSPRAGSRLNCIHALGHPIAASECMKSHLYPTRPSSSCTRPGRSVREEIHLLLDEHVQELEERCCREADDVVVIAVHLADEHAAESLGTATSAKRRTLAWQHAYLSGEPARPVDTLSTLDVRFQ